MATAMHEHDIAHTVPLPEDDPNDFRASRNTQSMASMVSVRLSSSKASDSAESPAASPAEGTSLSGIEHFLHDDEEEEDEPKTPVVVEHPDGNAETPRPRPGTIYAAPPRRSSSLDLVEPDDDDGSSITEASENSDIASVQGNRRSSGSTSKDLESTEETTERGRSSSRSSEEAEPVDWSELDKTEESEPKDEQSEESVALLLARLEQENIALAHDPKSKANVKQETRKQRLRNESRPPSVIQLRKLVGDPKQPRLSRLPSPPPMTELEFWAALVQDYVGTAQRLPTLTSNKIRGGIPPPLRGVTWVSMAGARERTVEEAYDRLCNEPSSYEGIISKDIGRSFPEVEMFRDADGEGQRMLKNVLKAFSLYDGKIGYCQGLGFLVGPLLMQAGEKEAFCLLVRLMDQYDLRSCFLPDLSGLHLRIFQFQRLLSQNLPELAAHLESMQVEAAYLSQWFLSFFAVTCPLPLLFRIYDVIFAEGASETLMRVALALMKRNEERLFASSEFEDVMHLLLSRSLWDPYHNNGDDLVIDFVAFTGVVTRDSLQSLETVFKAGGEGPAAKASSPSSIQSAASSFLGRLWSNSSTPQKSTTLSPEAPATKHRGSFLRRSPSKQSLVSNLSFVDSGSSSTSSSLASTAITDPSPDTAKENLETASIKSQADSLNQSLRATPGGQERDLQAQIEELLTAMTDMQREQQLLVAQLQMEREDRSEDGRLVSSLIQSFKKHNPAGTKALNRRSMPLQALQESSFAGLPEDVQQLARDFEARYTANSKQHSSAMFETKQQLRSSLARAHHELKASNSKASELDRQLEEKDREAVHLREELREARDRLRDGHEDRQKLERQLQDLRNTRRPSLPRLSQPAGGPAPRSPARDRSDSATSVTSGRGLREFKLGRTDTGRSTASAEDTYAPDSDTGLGSELPPPPTSQPAPQLAIPPELIATKRTSSLAARDMLAPAAGAPAPAARDEALLLELVNAKTAEAVARQELEEVKATLESLRKILGGGVSPVPVAKKGSVHHVPTKSATISMGSTTPPREEKVEKKLDTPTSTTSTKSTSTGWFEWGKRSVSRALMESPSS